MKRRSLVASVVAIAVLLSPTLASAQQGQVVARVTKGPIDLKRDNKNYTQARVGDLLLGGDLVKTKRGIPGQIRCTVTGKTWALSDSGVPLGVTTVCPLPSSSLNQSFRVKNRVAQDSSAQLQSQLQSR